MDEIILSYSQLRERLQSMLGRPVAPSTLNLWQREVLELPRYEPGSAREYTLEDLMALYFWANAGQQARRGIPRSRRRSWRIEKYSENLEKWQQNQGIR